MKLTLKNRHFISSDDVCAWMTCELTMHLPLLFVSFPIITSSFVTAWGFLRKLFMPAFDFRETLQFFGCFSLSFFLNDKGRRNCNAVRKIDNIQNKSILRD
jgi:nitrate reductase NapE component